MPVTGVAAGIRGEEQRGGGAWPRGGGGGGGRRAIERVGSSDLLSKGKSDVFSAVPRCHRSATVASGDAGPQRRCSTAEQRTRVSRGSADGRRDRRGDAQDPSRSARDQALCPYRRAGAWRATDPGSAVVDRVLSRSTTRGDSCSRRDGQRPPGGRDGLVGVERSPRAMARVAGRAAGRGAVLRDRRGPRAGARGRRPPHVGSCADTHSPRVFRRRFAPHS